MAAASALAGLPLEVEGLSKRFGEVVAVDDLTFRVHPGRVTGFLGPNGAGKTTTLRMIVGLVAPDAGSALLGGERYRDLPRPGVTVGAAIDVGGFHPGRSARDHLRVVAEQSGIEPTRVGAALDLVGLGAAAERRVSGFSMGMRQRLALATALMGQPTVLILDEPTNGLDPEGIAWLRDLLRWQADQGCTVLVSSHRLAEVAQSADDVVILNEGRLVREQPLAALLEGSRPRVRVRTPQAAALAVALADFGIGTTAVTATELLVDASDPAAVGAAAMRVGAELHLLAPERPDLEQVFLSLVDDSPDGGLR